ncbi:MAG: hypothetical protein M3381_14875 [Actinomycetota bacterium]|nr:hypothetical protein [Actinomycetota bacterium]
MAEFDVIDFLHILADRIVDFLDVDAVGIMLADERGRPHPVASSNEQARLIEAYTAQKGEGPVPGLLQDRTTHRPRHAAGHARRLAGLHCAA